MTTTEVPQRAQPRQRARRRVHRAWWVAAVAFVAIIGAAGFRATPGVLITPLQEEFGWSRGPISAAVSVNLLLFGLTAPFAAALMDRFGMRRVVAVALLLVALGSGLTVFMTDELAAGPAAGACWSGSAPGRWRWSSWRPSPAGGSSSTAGVVTGVLTAAGATGQLIFLPLLAALAADARLADGRADRHRRRAGGGTAGGAADARPPGRRRADRRTARRGR